MSDSPCSLVIEHEGILGGMVAKQTAMAEDVAHIKKKVDNGLAAKLDAVEKALSQSITDNRFREATQDSQNWFTRLLTGSVQKIIGLCITFIILNALVSNGLWAFLKVNYLKESPGQQQSILNRLDESYHSHTLSGGKILLHSGNASKPAWCLDPKTNKWEPVPNLRTEGSF